MGKEEWKTIQDFPNYEISNYGYSYGDVQRACETKIKHKGLRWEYV